MDSCAILIMSLNDFVVWEVDLKNSEVIKALAGW